MSCFHYVSGALVSLARLGLCILSLPCVCAAQGSHVSFSLDLFSLSLLRGATFHEHMISRHCHEDGQHVCFALVFASGCCGNVYARLGYDVGAGRRR